MKAWWENLSQREKLIIGGGGAVLAVVMLYLFLYSPLIGTVNKLQKQVTYQSGELAKVRQINTDIQNLSVSSIAPAFGLNDLQASLKQVNLDSVVKKIQQPQTGQFLLDFTDADFDTIMTWLAQLSTQYNVHVIELKLVGVGDEPGLVNGTILLQKR